jgi:hypothetical protein
MEEKKEQEQESKKLEEERKKAEEKVKKEKYLESRTKNILIIVGIIIVALIITFAFKDDITDFIKEKAGTIFYYNNFKFEKVYFGEIPMYQTELYMLRQGTPVRYNLLLRNDPRDLAENINVTITNPKIRRRSFFSLAPESDDCNNTILGAWKVSEFLGALGINNTGAVTDPAQIVNTSYEGEPDRVKTCEDAVNATVMVLQEAESSFISQEYQGKEYQDCFVLNYKDCETVEVAERFIMYLIEEFNKKN